MQANRMPLEGWIKVRMYSLLLGCLVLLAGRAEGARPRFDSSTDMGLVLVPADAEVESVIFRLRATDQDADFPLIFDITATVTPVVRVENLPCTLYNKICQANVILTKRLTPGRLHDFAVRVRDSKGDSNSMQATISVTNATTQRDKIFPHIPAIIMVPEDAKPGKELDYILVRSNQWSGKPVYIELWQPKELFTIRQRQTPAETRGIITLIGELDFETQSMYTLTMYATDPYTEPKKDTRNIAGLHLVVIVQDVQDVPPIFTLAPPLTKINNTVQPGDVILRVRAEDGDKGVPREVTYGLVSEGNPFTPFFNISETTGEIILARPLEELTQITHVGAPVVLSVVAEEIRRSTTEPPAQATVVEVGLLLGEPGNSPPFFENDNYVAWMDENAEPGSLVTFTEHYSTKVRDEDIGKAGVFALKLDNNNGTFEISPTVAERTANFIITVRDNSLIDYEIHKSLRFKIIAQEVGPATNLSATVPATIFLRDVNDNAPEFEAPTYEVTLSENVTAGTRVLQVHATDKDTGLFGRIQYTRIIGPGGEAFVIDPDTGIITVAMGTSALDREITPILQLSVEARDEDGKGLRGTVPLIVNLLDVNDNAPIFETETYQFTLNEDMTNFTMPAIIKAFDADAEPPNNEIRYELIHGNYENKFYLNDITGELFLREPVNKVRRTRHNPYQNFATKFKKGFVKVQRTFQNMTATTVVPIITELPLNVSSENNADNSTSGFEEETPKIRKKREEDDVLFTLTARAYDLGVPHMSGVTQVSVLRGPVAGARNVMFVVPGENPDPGKTAETLAAITGGRITVQEIRPYTSRDVPTGSGTNVPSLEGGKKSIVVARVEPIGDGTSFVDIERIRAALVANGVDVIGGDMTTGNMNVEPKSDEPKSHSGGTSNQNSNTNTNTVTNITTINKEEVTVYKAENRLLFWLLIILGLLMLIALIALIICCICPGCPFYMAPRKRRVHSSETLVARSDGRPKRHLHRKHARLLEATWQGRKQAWSADPTRRNWQFNRRNHRAPGLASLPGDVHIIDRDHEVVENTGSLRLRDGPVPMYVTDSMRRPDEERIYIEDVEGLRAQGYGVVDMESLRQHDVERGPDMTRQVYVGEEEQRVNEPSKFVREQHFYRDGNAEVLRLVTRGPMEEAMIVHPGHRPQTLVIDQGQSGAYRVDGKEILLQRFIKDQEIRHANGGQDLHDSLQDIEHRSMESHQRQKEAINLQQQQQQQQQQPKILLIPERLEEDHRQHIEELGPDVQRLIIDHGSFEKTARFEPKDSQELIPGSTLLLHASIPKMVGEKVKEQTPGKSVSVQHYSIHDLELARQNALLTRLLLERDGREVGIGAMVDSASYLETQSLPGQVAIATQTDRTTATQTELPNRSRSDNDESEEEARIRKKLKSKKRYAYEEPKRIRTLWLKSPIKEEDAQYCTEKRANIIRRKMKDIKDNRRISLEPDVLREISDSLDENGDPPITTRRRDDRDDSNSRVESRNDDENGRLEDSSSVELTVRDGRRIVPEKRIERNTTDEEVKRKSHREQREIATEPSFRILEKEMSSLSKKLSKLAGKKILQSSNGSETDSQEKIKTVVTECKKVEKKTDSQVTEIKKPSKATETMKTKRSKSTPRTTVSEYVSTKEQVKIRDENIFESKPRQVYKYRKSQTISTASSDFEDALEKPKKQQSQMAHIEKQKKMTAKPPYIKLKRQNRVEHKGPSKVAPLVLSQEIPEQKDTSDSASKRSFKSGKTERESTRMKKFSSGISETKIESAPLSSSSPDDSKNIKIKRKEGPVGDIRKKSTAETSETSGRTSPAESVRKETVEETVIEIKRASPEAPEIEVKVVPGIVVTQKSDSFDVNVDKQVIDVSTAPASPLSKSRESTQNKESFDSVQDEIFTMPKEALNNFLTHEMNDSAQALQAQYHSIAEGAGRIKDIILGSVAMESEDREREGAMREEIPDNIKFKHERSADVTQEKEVGSVKLKDEEIASALQTKVPEPTELKDTKSIEVLGKELNKPIQMTDNESAGIGGKEVSELLILRDNGKISVLQEGELSGHLKLDDQGSVSVIEVKHLADPIELEEKEISDLARKELSTEHIHLENKKGLDAKQNEEATEPIKLENTKSLDDVRKEEAQKPFKLEDQKVLDATRKENTPEPTKLEDKKSLDVIKKDEMTEPIKLNDKKSSEDTKKQEGIEPIQLDEKKSSEVIRKEEITETTKLEDKKSPDTIRKEEVTESTKLTSSDHFEEWGDISQGTSSHEDQKFKKGEFVTQQSEDAGMFSDNFDSFCGTDIHPKGSLNTQSSGGEFSYETLQSESTDDQNTQEKISHIKDAEKKDNIGGSIDKSKEISVSSEIVSKEETKGPRISPPKTPTLPQSDDGSPEPSSKKLMRGTPSAISPESEQQINGTNEMTMKGKTNNATDIPVANLDIDTNISVKGVLDIPEPASDLIKSPEDEKTDLKSVESHIVQIPMVLPLDIKITDETNPESPPEQSESKSEILDASPRPLSRSEEIMLETGSQKEFGIADSLFVDAKLLKSPSRSVKGLTTDAKEKEPQREKLIDGQKKMEIDVPAVSLVELSRVMLDDADDSDSSEASSKTMLTARPYGTPRHRPISGTDSVQESEANIDKSTDLLEETTENLRVRVSQKIHEGLETAGELIESATKIGEKLVPEETTQKPQEDPSKIQIEYKPGISGRVIEDTGTIIKDVGKVLPDIKPSEPQAHVELHADEGPGISIEIGEEHSKKLEITAALEEDAKTDATSEKVQQLYQIPQEKLPADADGFNSLPEKDKPMKSLDDTKFPEKMQALPVEFTRTSVEAPVIKVLDAGIKKADVDTFLRETYKPVQSLDDTKLLEGVQTSSTKIGQVAVEAPVAKVLGVGSKKASTGKDTKGVVRKKESSKDDVPTGSKKLLPTSSKTLSPKKEKKIKTLKEESSKIGKQSVIVGQLARPRDSKRQNRPADLQVEEQADPVLRSSQFKRLRKKVDHPEKDVQQQEKVKPEKTKKALTKSESEKSVSKKPNERRGTQEKLIDPSGKKVQDKTEKTGRRKKSVVESLPEKASKAEKAQHIDQQEVDKKFGDPKEKKVEQVVGLSKHGEIKLLASVEITESVIPISQKDNDGDKKDVEEPTSKLTSSTSSNVKKESPEHIVNKNQNKEITLITETTLTNETFTSKQNVITTETKITKETTMREDAIISEEGKIKENTAMSDEKKITDEAAIAKKKKNTDDAVITEERKITEDARMTEEQNISENIAITKEEKIRGDTTITEEKRVSEDATMIEGKKITQDSPIIDETKITEEATIPITEKGKIEKDSTMSEGKNITEDATITEKSTISEGTAIMEGEKITQDATITEERKITDDAAMAGGENITEGVIASEKIKITEEAAMAGGEKITENVTASEKNKITDEAAMAGGEKITEDVTATEKNKITEEAAIAGGKKITEGVTASEKNKITEEAAIAGGVKITEGVTATEQIKIAEEAAMAGGDNITEGVTATEKIRITDEAVLTEAKKITEDGTVTEEKKITEDSTMAEGKKITEGATTTDDRKNTEHVAVAEGEMDTEGATRTEEKTMPKQTVMSADKTVIGTSTLTDEISEATALSKSPKGTDVTVRMEANQQIDVPVNTSDVTKLPAEVAKIPIEIMKGTVGTHISNIQSEVEATTLPPSTGIEINEGTKDMESSRKAAELTDMSVNQPDLLKSSDRKQEENRKLEDAVEEGPSTDSSKLDKSSHADGTSERPSPPKVAKHRKETEMVVIESQSRYMEWYKQTREEMERKRQERKDGEEEEERPKWLRKSTRQRWFKGGPDDKRIFDPKIGETTPRRKKIKPLVNVESEQLKAIVRQGRALRKAQGETKDEPQIQIFAPEKPPTPLSSIPVNSRYHHHHHLVQHSEYKYEKMPLTPFYLHPPPAPHSSPQIPPQQFESMCPEQYQSLPSDSRCPNEGCDSGIIVQPQQGGNKLRHQQLLEKKSVFDIAYSEAAPSQLRADSTTPPS